jgi:glycine/D-amino acid oxidase-like deaminating enzyme
VLKLANHGPGRALHPADDTRELLQAEEELLRSWLQRVRPELLDAPIVHRRLCVYGDSLDGDFWIDRHCEGLVVAAGGSGHGFKFGPVLGELIANLVEGRPHPLAPRFARRGHRPGWVEAARATA